jgi:hypothetical protein
MACAMRRAVAVTVLLTIGPVASTLIDAQSDLVVLPAQEASTCSPVPAATPRFRSDPRAH